MDPSHSARSSDAKIVALLVVMLACLVALIALLFHDESVSESRMEPLLSAHAAMLHSAPSPVAKTAVVDARPGKPVTPEENWAADESSQGLRPEAAH